MPFSFCESLEISYCCIVKIGDDAILVKYGDGEMSKFEEDGPIMQRTFEDDE